MQLDKKELLVLVPLSRDLFAVFRDIIEEHAVR